MKKILLIILLIQLSEYCSAQSENGGFEIIVRSPSIDAMQHIAKDYFRSNPYRMPFSSFIKHLINDPMIINKTIKKKTDSSLFSFKGEYKNFSPYGFLADRTEIRLTEIEMDLYDSSTVKDTVLIYQLLGFSYGSVKGLEAVKKEFSKFNRRYGKNFDREDSEISQTQKIEGIITNYFVKNTSVSPVFILWAKLDEFQNVFSISFRIKVQENFAQLPVPPETR